ncbi:hypothetical protein LUX39_43610 [Actinomadura madurae]|nr:hypothetical protein [Actinomadura madurae]
MKPSSKTSEPRNVYRKNFSADRDRSPCPHSRITKYMPAIDRSKKTKNSSRSSAANNPRHTVSRNRKRIANARTRCSCRSEYTAQAANRTAVSASSGSDRPSTPTW